MMAIGALGASKSRVMLVMVQVSSMKTSREASTCFWRLCPTRSVTRYVRTIPLARDERLFLSVTPNRFQGRHVNYHSDGARDGTRLIGLDRA
jgi:hypothetical protein